MLDLDRFLETFFKDKPVTKPYWERVYKSMIVHTRGVKPKELLEIKRPNEPKYVKDYRLANYREITKHGINQAIDSIFRVLSSSNYSIVYSKTLQDYLAGTKFKFLEQRQDFHTLFFNTILRLIFDDPNGLLVWLPENSDPSLPPIEQVENTPINVIPFYVCSKDIMHLNEDVAAFVGGKMVVNVPDGKKTKEVPTDYYFICTHEFIYRYEPEWSKEDKKIVWKIHDWYNLSLTDGEPDRLKEFPSAIWHQLGGNVAMGEIVNKDGSTNQVRYYDSFYGGYVPFGDECICAFSDNQAVRVRYNFPFIEAKGQVCIMCKGGGQVLTEEGAKIKCENCSGGGRVLPLSPHGEYINEPPTTSDNPDYINLPAIRFHSPDVSILKSSSDAWREFLKDAKDAVNLVHTEEAQSGVAKDIDREQKYETLIKITQNFFSLIRWSLQIIEAYKVPFIDSRQESKVTEPESFSIKSESQLMAELNEMTQKETPQAFISTTSKMIADKIYSDNEEAKIIVNILSKWDVFYGMSATSISQFTANGGGDKRDVLRHTRGYRILSELAMTKDLTALEPIQIIALAEAEINKMMPKDTLDMPISDTDNLGKIPLALQQLALARERAKTAGDIDLVNKIGLKMDELLAEI